MRCKVGDKVLVLYSVYNRPEVVGMETVIIGRPDQYPWAPSTADWICEDRSVTANLGGLAHAKDAQLLPLRGDPDAIEQDEYDAIPDMPVG